MKRGLGLAIAIAVLAAGFGYILPKSFAPAWRVTDFKYFWLAGELWGQGVSPYGSDYFEAARSAFERGSVPKRWAYPPHFRFITEPVAWMDFETAARVWRMLLVLSIAAGAALLVATARTHARAFPLWLAPLVAGLALTMTATAHSVSIGQSSPPVFLAYCVLLWGYVTERRLPVIVALVVMMIKPTYGLTPALFLLGQFRWWLPLFSAGALTLALTGLAILGTPPLEVVTGILDAFESYEGSAANAATSMNGIRHLIAISGGGDVSQLVVLGTGGAVALALGAWTKGAANTSRRLRAVILLTLVILLFAPLHTYDGYYVLAVTVPALALGRLSALVGIGLFLLTWRSGNLGAITGLHPAENLSFQGATIESLAALLAALVLATVLLGRQPNQR